jgi:hypothetical protein
MEIEEATQIENDLFVYKQLEAKVAKYNFDFTTLE